MTTIVTHPLLEVAVTQLRAATTPSPEFRRKVQEIASLVFIEASRSLELEHVNVVTPMAETSGHALVRPIVLVPILRAGLGMVDGIWPLVPSAQIAHIGIFRDEETALPQPYYSKFPTGLEEADVFLLDPMLATGQSAVEAVRQLLAHGAQRVRFLCLISCPHGLAFFRRHHPDVPVFTASVDAELDGRSYIIPGLGDAGDRYFGT
jgi:uracil phosphoribosyltransferase